jgi:hypothetical protein
MKAYGWSESHVLDELDGAKGWVYFNWARANEAQVFGTGIKIKGDGYIAQERNKIVKDTKNG